MRPHPTNRVRLALSLALCAVSPLGFAQAQQTPPGNVKPNKHDAKKAEDAYLAGARQIERGDLAVAQPLFERAANLNPARPEYAAAVAETRDKRIAALVQQAGKARMLHQDAQAEALLTAARAIDARNLRLAVDAAPDPTLQITPLLKPQDVSYAGAIQLAPLPDSREFHLHADTQQIVRQVADAYGIHTVFDDSVGHADVHFALDSAPYTQTMPILLRMLHLMAVPIDAKTLLFAKDTPDNHQKFEHQLEETVYVPGSTPEEMNELTNIVKNVFDVKQISPVNSSGTLLIRAPEQTLKAVNYVLADLIDGGAQVMLDLRLYSVDKTRTRVTGATVPSQYGAFSVSAAAQSLVTANQSTINQAIAAGAITLTGSAEENLVIEAIFLLESGLVSSAQFSGFLGLIGGGLTSLGVYQTGGATFNLSLNSSDVRQIDSAQVRIGDRQTTTFKVGSKYPITTSTYSTGASSTTSTATINGVSVASLLAQYTGSTTTTAVTPQVQYEDLGLTLKTTPSVLKSGLVSLHVDLKIEALTGSSLDGNPILTSRNIVSDVTTKDGMGTVILSHMSKSEIGSLDGVPGLSELPGFQDATEVTGEQDSSELVLTITPHIVRSHRTEFASPRIPFQPSSPQDY